MSSRIEHSRTPDSNKTKTSNQNNKIKTLVPTHFIKLFLLTMTFFHLAFHTFMTLGQQIKQHLMFGFSPSMEKSMRILLAFIT